MTSAADRGALAVVLHTHMPYVEGYGTWPFGEEWLWEAVATSYLPLLDTVLGRAPITLSLTPVLADQLEAPGIGERLLPFLEDLRADVHERDAAGCRTGGEEGLAREIERAAADYAHAAARWRELGGDLLGALAPHVRWTSSATHAVLPLLATDDALRLQLEAGIAAHRRRFGMWDGGLWLPECAHVARLEPHLAAAGVRTTCVDHTDLHGLGAAEHLRPQATEAGVTLVRLDRLTHERAWSPGGYPAAGPYRDTHHLTTFDRMPWANDGGVYDHDAALARARADAEDFVAATVARLDAGRRALGQAPLCVCALDTEFLGHWWYEGVAWLAAVVDAAARAGLAIVDLDEAARAVEPAPPAPAPPPVTTWGEPRDLTTWDGPRVADVAFRQRALELRVAAAGGERLAGVPDAVLRELLALQASDWAFLLSRGQASDYPRHRSEGHALALEQALAGGPGLDSRGPRHLAPDVRRRDPTAAPVPPSP